MDLAMIYGTGFPPTVVGFCGMPTLGELEMWFDVWGRLERKKG